MTGGPRGGRHAPPKPGTTGAAFRRVHHLTAAGEYIHALVRAGMEEALARQYRRQVEAVSNTALSALSRLGTLNRLLLADRL
jgi:hypothetical protein